jgi:hypothetical protein
MSGQVVPVHGLRSCRYGGDDLLCFGSQRSNQHTTNEVPLQRVSRVVSFDGCDDDNATSLSNLDHHFFLCSCHPASFRFVIPFSFI